MRTLKQSITKGYFFILLIFSVNIQAQEVDMQYLKTHPNWEKWHEKIPVSGGTRVGLMAMEDTTGKIPKKFFVDLPKNIDGKICVEISSRDGRYSAKAQYFKSKESLSEFPFPTKFYDQLKNYKINEVVLLASIGQGCENSEPVHYLVSSWTRTENPDNIVFYINSSLPSGITCENEGIQKICEETPAPSVAYTKKCMINAKELSGEYDFKIMQREESMGEISMNYYDFPVIYKK